MYRSTTEKYHNTEAMRKGLKNYELSADANGKKYIEKFFIYALKQISDGVEIPEATAFCYGEGYPALNEEIIKYYEGQTNAQITTRKKYDHGTFGNITGYHNFGDIAVADDSTFTQIHYFSDPNNKYLVGIADSMVTKHGNTILRQRSSTIDPNTGKTTKIIQYNNNNQKSVYDFAYNMYGNVTMVQRPQNQNQQRLSYSYEYDAFTNIYPTKITDSYGCYSSATYDFCFGKPKSVTDMNRNRIEYDYDTWLGRIQSITLPYESAIANINTIYYTYSINLSNHHHYTSDFLYVITDHYDTEYPTNKMKTVTFCDGMKRITQIKKDIEIADTEKRSVSGKIVYDAYGRVIKRYYPVDENNDSTTLKIFNPAQDNITPTTTTYDILDRITSVRNPLNQTTNYTYSCANDAFSKKRFQTQIKDPLNNNTYIFTDPRGLKTTVTTAPTATITKFTYNALGELLSTTDPNNHTTTYEYDRLGQCTARAHPDAGITRRKYDPAGNLVSLVTQNLNNNGDSIVYFYTYNRLDSIVYPDNPENNVHYFYGTAAETTYNRAGRLKRIEDATGFKELKYGALGEITEERRTMMSPFETNAYSFTHLYTYDSWNRLKTMTYPDGEMVSYHYDRGGNLKTVKSTINTTTTYLVQLIYYNKFEARTRIQYGNYVNTYYSYDNLQRMNRMQTYRSTTSKMQNLTYNYDAADNITNIQNAGNFVNGLGGTSTMNFTYDNLYRMTASSGSVYGSVDTVAYTLAMTYAADGRILSKNQNVTGIVQVRDDLTYNRTYSYNTAQPHTIQHFNVNRKDFEWDANGNMTWQKNRNRTLCWDEENRLMGVAGDDYGSFYLYDHAGERALKLSGNMTQMTVNGSVTNTAVMNKTTLYVSPYTTVNNTNISKHYYAGSERLMTNTGRSPILGISTHLGTAAQLTAKRNAQRNLLSRMATNCWNKTYNYSRDQLSYLTATTTNAYAAYYYHTDHLGSSSWISNSSGAAQQYLVYLPFGETLLDRCANTNWNTMFSFSGKERDLETGYSYFGARYYDAGTSIWLSVDPMADKYPGVGPYNYCGNNPIRLIDPDGREPIKSQAGTARGFVHTFNTTGTYSGTKTGVTAHNAMLSYGKTDFNFPRPMPANTGKINNYADKYIYTEEGGWIDMTHFMFYAGKAYQNKMDGVKDPIGEAVQAGYMQEMSDRVFAPHSAYSYEDLPSDKFGAEFGAKYFDPDSKQTFGEQLENYLNNVLKATDPQSAPNYNQLPITEPTSKPSRINKTTTPVYTKDNP